MLKAPIALVWLSLAVAAQAKLGENVPDLIKRFGNSYIKNNLAVGERYKFESENVSADVTVVDGASVAETYYSDHALNEKGEPPIDIVRAVLRTNVPHAKWLELDAAPFGADYALRSTDNNYIATLKYRGPRSESVVWSMTIARANAVGLPLVIAQPPPSATPTPTSPGPLDYSPRPTPYSTPDKALEERKRKNYETGVETITQELRRKPQDQKLLSERGFFYSLLGRFEDAMTDYEAALKLAPNDEKTRTRLASARAMLALKASPIPNQQTGPVAATTPMPLRPDRIQRPTAGGFWKFFNTAIIVIPAAFLYALIVHLAFKRKTMRWVIFAGSSAILLPLLVFLFVRSSWKHVPPLVVPYASPTPRPFDLNSISKDKELARYLKEQGEADMRRARGQGSPAASPTPFDVPPLPSATYAPVLSVAENIQRSVVLITGYDSAGRIVATGTGFFVSSAGHVITCWHIVAVDKLTMLDVRRTDGTGPYVEGVLGFSAINDLALLKTSSSDTEFLPIRPKTADKPEVGTRVLVFGNPGRLRGVWSEGAVAGFTFAGEKTTRDSLRFEAPVAPGSSGSPLVDVKKGDVVGIASAAGWMIGNLAVPFYYMNDLVADSAAARAVPVAEFKANLEKEKPALKQQVEARERAGNLAEAARLCEEYASRYPGDVWGSWEHAQISFAQDDYTAANYYASRLEPLKEDPGDDLLCAIQFETGDALFWAPAQRQWLRLPIENLRTNYGVNIYKAAPPHEQLNARERPDSRSNVLYKFDADEHVFAKGDRVPNRGGKEAVMWRKVRLLPTPEHLHGGEGWVNERYLAPFNPEEN